uniref:Transmembrane protein n=1 Tax=Noccaea caerulescens TaxID=107243 RepID=A0A1J3IPC8_NOCCA
MMRRRQRDQDSRVFYDLSALVLSLLRSPPMPISLPDQFPDSPNPPMRIRPPSHRFSSSASMAHISPSGFASLLLGISVALMLCGSVTFFIGFLLMPWVLALIMVFYVAGIVSAISMAGRSILCYVLTPPSSSGKEISEWKLL